MSHRKLPSTRAYVWARMAPYVARKMKERELRHALEAAFLAGWRKAKQQRRTDR